MSLLETLHQVGHGPHKVIVVHGWMAGAALFDPLHGWLDPERFTYAFMDCRGYGARREAPGPFTVEQIARDMLALADLLDWSRFSVVGHSMAGMAAQWLQAHAAERLVSVVLLASVPASGATLSPERRALLGDALHEPLARQLLISANVGHCQDEEWLRGMLQLSLRTTWVEAMSRYLESWSGDDFAEAVKGARVPTLVLVGERDPGCTVASMNDTLMRWLPTARLEILPAVGHYPMREAPAELARVIETWLLARAERC
ncbi:alpha/beta fold hydrolase [Pseudomonas sp. NY15374]|uniref:alpha/beta fold hydrolase n=1 Tax=Pseudomonas sp. NY15374 TaxID=3400357 RepID=UPI003A85CCB0